MRPAPRAAPRAPHGTKRKLGASSKALIVCVILAFLCIAGGITTLKLDPAPPWAGGAERAFMIGTQMFLFLGILLKGVIRIFDRPDEPGGR